MNRALPVIVIAALLAACSQNAEKPAAKFNDPCATLFDQALKPFYHGVARVTPDDSVSRIAVEWEISDTPDFVSVYKSDTTSTTPARDYTVKVDVDALKPGSVYYYRFKALGAVSSVGRTKTTPVSGIDSLKLAVVSCANWEWGYFSAYEKIADRKDVDAVLHLGDYIYEYGRGKYGDTTMRKNLPPHEIVSLSDYRTRHSSYRTDRGLRVMSQQHPLIAIWDDHEVANDAYTAGAQNHQNEEGDYMQRKNAAKQAYYEWIPIRENTKLYRSFSYGTMADVLMLDERLEGRTKPADSITDPGFNNDDRAMLGADQLTWLEQNLKDSKTTWKVIGNQVMFSDVYLSNPNRPRNLDSWDGYPAEKSKLRNFLVDNKLKDVIFLTGDTHASWAIEAATDARKKYVPFAVELGTTSVSSANEDERRTVDEVKQMEAALLKENPHIKYVNQRDHGYLLLTLYNDKAKAEWYFMESLRTPDTKEILGKSFTFTKGTFKLK